MDRLLKAQLFQEVNERMAELLERAWPSAPGDFLCECGGRDCRSTVTLSLADYRRIRERGDAVLAPHEPRRAGLAAEHRVERVAAFEHRRGA